MIETVEYSTVVCDNCGNRFGGFTGSSPQAVTRELIDKYGWTAFDDIHHCGKCPPICSHCGLDDLDCECTTHTGDSAYVSREPNVIDPACNRWIDCDYADEYCRRCDVPENSEAARGQG